ncbi:MAG TPA: acetate--CoA ligase family protein, partial [Vicinamibacterales bacterium]
LLRMSCLAEGVPEIAELDLNPVIALAPGAGCRVIDARIRVALPAGQSRHGLPDIRQSSGMAAVSSADIASVVA